MLKRISDFLNEYLRINAIRRMLSIVDVRSTEVGGLVVFAVVFAIFEGVGLSLLLPILQYADGGQTAIIESSGIIWQDDRGLHELLPPPRHPADPPAARVRPHPAAAGGVLLQRLVLGRGLHPHRHAPEDADARHDPRRRPRVLLAPLRRASRGRGHQPDGRGRQRHPCRHQTALDRTAHAGLRRDTARALGSAHAQHPVLRGHGVSGGAGQHQTDPRATVW